MKFCLYLINFDKIISQMKYILNIFFILSISLINSCKNNKEVHLNNDTIINNEKITIETSTNSKSDTSASLSIIETNNNSVKDSASNFKTKNKDNLNLKNDSLNKYHIYISLDDGPQEGTRNCWKILKECNVPATFFMIGVHNEGKSKTSLVDSIHNDPLFVIGNHSNTHAYFNKYSKFYNDPSGSINDFILAEKNLNLNSKIARLLGRNTWSVDHIIKGELSALKTVKKLDSLGYSVFGWDTEWHFKNGNIPVQSADEMVRTVNYVLKNGKTHSKNSIVILVHDRMFQKPEHAASFKKFIVSLKENNNYYFNTLNNYSK
ncbi:hypothetical protein ETU10_05340 [Apibacter muscae]|nr:hypothetical protein ETU10_05340 [Apibacter muscae]